MENNEVMETVNEVTEAVITNQKNNISDKMKYGIAFAAGAVACKFAIIPGYHKVNELIKGHRGKKKDFEADNNEDVIDISDSKE